MGEILHFKKRAQPTETPSGKQENLTRLLKNAFRIVDAPVGEEIRSIFRLRCDIGLLFERNMNRFLLDQKLCGESWPYLCSRYVSRLIARHLNQKFESHYVFDFLEKGINNNEPQALQKGGDYCFIICALFGGREWRSIKKEDYYRMGAGCYAMFYSRTHEESAFLMSRHYEDIVKLTQIGIQML